MCLVRGEVPVGFTGRAFPTGTHMCLIYDNENQQRKLIARFLQSGLDNGENVAYFADVVTKQDVRNRLEEMGLDIPTESGAAQLSGSVAMDTYCPYEQFVPEEMLETLRGFHRRSTSEGYSAARVSGEMSRALQGIPGSERLMEYEAMVNDVLETHPVTAICQYDANRFDGSTILDVLRVHPMMIVHGQIMRNPYYIKPREFLTSLAGAQRA